jgi:hypothetical protein
MSRLYTEHLYGNVRASYGTQGTSCTFATLSLFSFHILGRMVALDIKLVVYHYGPLGARCNAKPAPLAKVFVDPDKTFLQRPIPYLTR